MQLLWNEGVCGRSRDDHLSGVSGQYFSISYKVWFCKKNRYLFHIPVLKDLAKISLLKAHIEHSEFLTPAKQLLKVLAEYSGLKRFFK